MHIYTLPNCLSCAIIVYVTEYLGKIWKYKVQKSVSDAVTKGSSYYNNVKHKRRYVKYVVIKSLHKIIYVCLKYFHCCV